MAILNERIKECREKLKMSQAELAELLGYSDRSTIAKIEKGTNDITQSKIEAFARVLHTTPAYLMGWEDESGTKDLGLTAFDIAKWLDTSPGIVDSVMEEMGWPDATNPEILSKISAKVEREKIRNAQDADLAKDCVSKEFFERIANLGEEDQQLILAMIKRMEDTGKKSTAVRTRQGAYFLYRFPDDQQIPPDGEQ